MDGVTESLLETLNKSESGSLMKKHLTPALQGAIKGKKTKLGGNLGACIRSGVENLTSSTGIYACDAEAYDLYSDLFNPIIREYHRVPPQAKDIYHPKLDWGDLDDLGFGDLDPEGKHIVSTRVRVGRSVAGFGFPPTISKADRMDLEKRAINAFTTLEGELKGQYVGLVGMDEKKRQEMVNDHFLFKNDDKYLASASGYDDWPNGRGIYHNANKTFLSWVNEEDHLRIISMQMGGNLAEVYKRLVKAVIAIDKKVPFARHDNLGYLTFCPTNLGTAMRASVHMKIPDVAKLPHFKEICEELKIQPRGIHGEHTESEGGVYDLSNKRRLGISEYEVIKEMASGVKILLLLQKSLERK